MSLAHVSRSLACPFPSVLLPLFPNNRPGRERFWNSTQGCNFEKITGELSDVRKEYGPRGSFVGAKRHCLEAPESDYQQYQPAGAVQNNASNSKHPTN